MRIRVTNDSTAHGFQPVAIDASGKEVHIAEVSITEESHDKVPPNTQKYYGIGLTGGF